jgi:hypothetical protein
MAEPSHRRLVRLRDRFPKASRMTRWRIRNEEGFPDAVVIRNTEYFYEDELEAHEERRRRRDNKARPADASLEQPA